MIQSLTFHSLFQILSAHLLDTMPSFEAEQDDGSHRMRVADRYKSNAKLRKLIRPFAIIQITYICVRTVWNMLPVALLGESHR